MDHGILIIEASRSHSDTPHLIGLLGTSDQPVAETSTRQHTTLTRDRYPPQTPPHPEGFEPTIPPSVRPKTHTLDRTATRIGLLKLYNIILVCLTEFNVSVNSKFHRNTSNDFITFNLLKAELIPICHLLALLEAHHILHVSRIRVKRQVKSNLPSAGITRSSPYSPR